MRECIMKKSKFGSPKKAAINKNYSDKEEHVKSVHEVAKLFSLDPFANVTLQKNKN